MAITDQLTAIILAAGKSPASGEPMALQSLGNRKVIDYVIENVEKLVPPEQIYIVVGFGAEAVQAHLGDGYHYIEQSEQLGTGHAVLQAQAELADRTGDLLILYGDTPLLRNASLRGLINRHRLRQADLTLLTAISQQARPYGRIVRDLQGQIVAIIEAQEASARVREITELNVGAYVVHAQNLFPTLQALSPSPVDGQYRLTDCVHQLIRTGLQVESYRIYDEGEMIGINDPADIAHAEFELQKRFYRPRRHEEEFEVKFGTGGWRAVIGEGFTLYNVRRLCQALANAITRAGKEKQGVLIGYDRRFLSDQAGNAAAEVFAGNNIPVFLLAEDAATPLITYATADLRAVYGLAFTASHNPPEWNGLKVFKEDGSLLLDDESRQISAETNQLTLNDIIKLELDIGLETGIIRKRDYTNAYVDAVEKFIDLKAIRDANLRVIVDPMYGVGQLTLGIILNDARCRVSFIHERRNPLFGGRSPAPDLHSLQMLITHIREDGYDLGLAMDGDADRIAIVDERGNYVSVNEILILLYWYLLEVRKEKGGVVRNLATTHLLDRLAAHYGENCLEVPVGFKHIASGMSEHDLLLGGESSGGLTIRGHILGKDGIFACALIVEMLAKTKLHVSELLEKVWEITGRLYSVEANFAATPEMRVLVPQKINELLSSGVSPYPIVRISEMDGLKLYFENDNWVLLRFSGTEPALRIFAEADSEEKAHTLIRWLTEYAQIQA